MKKSTILSNVFIVLVLILTAAGLSGQDSVLAQSGDDVELQAADASMPPPTDVFPGLQRALFPPNPAQNNDRWAAGSVPDVSGAPGTYWYVQAVNDWIAVYIKDGTQVYSNTLNGFWGTYGNTGTLCDGAGSRGQPNVLFDEGSGRFVIADVAYDDIDNGPYYICIITSDEEGVALNSYALDTDTGQNNYYPDSVKLGIWQDSYYLAANMVDIDNNGLVRTPYGAKVWALKGADMTTCKDLNNDTFCEFDFMSHYLNETFDYHYLVPSTYSGLAPTADTPNYFATIKPGKFYIWEFEVDWNSFTSSFGNNLNPSYTINTDTSGIWATGSIVPQWDVPEKVDVHGERLGTPLQYRIVDGVPALWVTHAVESGQGTGQRWYEIRFDEQDKPLFFQDGTFAPDDDYRWNGSLAVDGAGNMALGYNVSTDETAASLRFYPEIRYAGRLRTDLNGTLPRTEVLFEEGGYPVYDGFQYDNDGVPDGPWGRQSHMSVDPLDDCIFWYTNMYYDANSNGTDWRTAIGWFSFPQCGAGQTKRVSLSTQDAQGNGTSGLDFEMYSVGISASGRYVAFSSEASTLVSGDNAGHRDVFLRDRDYDEDGIYDEPGEVLTTRISTGWDGSEANDDSWEVSVSGFGLYDLNDNGSLADEVEIDGRYVTFSSDADNLVEPEGFPDSNHARDIFVYDRITGETIRASVRDLTEKSVGNNTSDQPFISQTGDYVVFRSKATNLILPTADINNSIADIYLRDLTMDRTYLVSVDAGGVQHAEESAYPTISDDGLLVAFQSRADLAGGDGNGTGWDVFVRDLVTPTTVRVSGGNGDSYTPYISGGGQYVVFASRADNLPIPNPDTNGYADIFIYDLLPPNDTDRVSVNFYGGEALNGDSYSPSVTSDGRYISFASDANNLDVHLQDTNNQRDIYLHDRTIGLTLPFATFGLTKRVSLDYQGGQTNGGSFAPVIAPNGRHIAYVSAATDLVNNDTNNAWDVFAYDSHRVIPTFLTIPTNVSGGVGDIVSVPVKFKNGYAIDSTVFSIDFDEVCLSFNPSLAGAVTFNLPSDFIKTWTYNAADKDGEIDISIYDHIAPRTLIPEGTIVRIKFKIKSACLPAPGSINNARVGFSSDPHASFGSNGQSILGYASDGFVRILAGKLGDCNGDDTVDAGDLSALVLEFFDGDGVLPANTPSGSYPGNPIGCNPNQDMVVDAGDLSCTVLIIWGGGSAACTGTLSAASNLSSQFVDKVSLTLPESYPAIPRQQVSLPVSLDPKGKLLTSLVFSIDLDQSWLSFDSSDGNHDGVPDSISLNLPPGYVASTAYDPGDTDGELDVVIYYPGVASTPLPAGNLMTFKLKAGAPQGNFVAEVKSSLDPQASFGSTTGTSVPGTLVDGSVWIFNTLLNQIYLPFSIDTR
ncbi:MAG: cohesin domain-containing protein [Anaerolineales bacterium]